MHCNFLTFALLITETCNHCIQLISHFCDNRSHCVCPTNERNDHVISRSLVRGYIIRVDSNCSILGSCIGGSKIKLGRTRGWGAQKTLTYIPCLGQHPQFYYPVQVKQQNERRLVLKSHLLVRVIEKIQIEYPPPPHTHTHTHTHPAHLPGWKKRGISLREERVACFTRAHQLYSIPFPFLNASGVAY